MPSRTNVYTWQAVLSGNLLGSEMLLHLFPRVNEQVSAECKHTYCQRIVRASFHCCIVCYDHALAAGYPTNPSDDPSTWNGFSRVDVLRSQGRELKERCMGIQEQSDSTVRLGFHVHSSMQICGRRTALVEASCPCFSSALSLWFHLLISSQPFCPRNRGLVSPWLLTWPRTPGKKGR